MQGDTKGSGVILLVDDEQQVRDALAKILKGGGYQVIAAPGGEDALRLFKDDEERVELVITDIVMPGMSGIALGKTLNDIAPKLPVLFITGFADMRLEGTHTALLQKPFSAQQLLGKVASMLAGEKVA